MGQGASLIDVLLALLQSIVVLLLASGVYIALVARKPEEVPNPAEDPAAPPPSPRGITRAGSVI